MLSEYRPYLRSLVVGLLLWPGTALGQTSVSRQRPFAANVVVPQSRSFVVGRAPAVQIQKVDVRVEVVEQVATTTMDIGLYNPSGRRLEAELLVPVPDGAVVRSFTFQGAAAEPTAQILPHEEARRIYNEIVAKIRDPALLEFAGYNLVRSSVFPVAARGTQKVRLVYEHLLPADGNRSDYVLPRTESLAYDVPWSIRVTLKSKRPISTVYSPGRSSFPICARPTESPLRYWRIRTRRWAAAISSCWLACPPTRSRRLRDKASKGRSRW